MENALEALPRLSGNLLSQALSYLLMMMPSCLTYLAAVNSLPKNAREGYSALLILVLDLYQVVLMSQLHSKNHLMLMETVNPLRIPLVSMFLLKVPRTCSRTRRVENSQSPKQKYGKLSTQKIQSSNQLLNEANTELMQPTSL